MFRTRPWKNDFLIGAIRTSRDLNSVPNVNPCGSVPQASVSVVVHCQSAVVVGVESGMYDGGTRRS